MKKKSGLVIIGQIIGFGLIFFLFVICMMLGGNPFAGTVSWPEFMGTFVCPLIYFVGLCYSLKRLKLAGIIVLSSVAVGLIISILDNGFDSSVAYIILSATPGVLFLIQVLKNEGKIE